MGEFDDELPIFHFEQQDASFSGLEAELFTPIFIRGESEIDLRVFADYVNGKLSNGEYLPRMPPLRYGSRIQYHDDRFLVGLEVTLYDDQDKIADIETPTAGYTMVNADFNWTVTTPGGSAFEIFVIGSNLADEEGAQAHFVRQGYGTVAGAKHFGRIPLALLTYLLRRQGLVRA